MDAPWVGVVSLAEDDPGEGLVELDLHLHRVLVALDVDVLDARDVRAVGTGREDVVVVVVGLNVLDVAVGKDGVEVGGGEVLDGGWPVNARARRLRWSILLKWRICDLFF